METATAWVLALPILMALAAVGAVLLIKVTRRRQGTRDPRHTAAVPVNALSRHDARSMLNRYLVTLLFTLVLIAMLFTAAW